MPHCLCRCRLECGQICDCPVSVVMTVDIILSASHGKQWPRVESKVGWGQNSDFGFSPEFKSITVGPRDPLAS